MPKKIYILLIVVCYFFIGCNKGNNENVKVTKAKKAIILVKSLIVREKPTVKTKPITTIPFKSIVTVIGKEKY